VASKKKSVHENILGAKVLKKDFADLVMDGMTSHKHSLAAKEVSKWRPPKSLLLGQMSSG